MDPEQTYPDMYHAMREGDFDTAREFAFALKRWLASGGFYPYQYTPEAINAYICSVLRRTAGHPEPVFSLVCESCDAGADIGTEEQAIAEGWTCIQPAPDLLQANYVGTCPDCRE